MISIFLPAYNEELLITNSVFKLHNYLSGRDLEHEIIVVSNGSTDQTVKIAEELASQNEWFKFAALPERGAGRAFACAIREASGEYIICLDMDLSSDLIFIDFASHLLEYADMIVGSKTMGEQRRSLIRVIPSQLYIMFSNLLFDLTISDYSIGCKAFKKSSIWPALNHLDKWTGYIFELCLFLKCQGKKIVQIGVDCNDQRESRFNLFHEGFYRYSHLFRCWSKLRRSDSWFHQTDG